MLRAHVVAAVDVLRERMAEAWTLESLAEEVHLSQSQLTRSFDAVAGISPLAYLRQLRVTRMASLLRSTDLSVGAVARSVGWHDSRNASRHFRAAYGVSPTAYRLTASN